MSFASNRRIPSAGDLGHSQLRTQAYTATIASRSRSPFAGSRTEVDVDEVTPQIISQQALSRELRVGLVSEPVIRHRYELETHVAGMFSERCFGGCSQQRGVGAPDLNNEIQVDLLKIVDELEGTSKNNVETLQCLASVRDDILSEIRSLKLTLLEELHIIRNHATYFPTHPVGASPAEEFPASPVLERIGTPQGNLNPKLIRHSEEITGASLSEKVAQSLSADSSGMIPDGALHSNLSRGVQKSVARLQDEAILNNLRQHRRTRSPLYTPSELIKDNWHNFNSSRNVYDVKSMYHETGVCQTVARHDLFEQITLVVIIVNGVWMSVDADMNGANSLANAGLAFVLADVMFYIYFAGEIMFRFLAFKHKSMCCRDGSFVFDLVLVILYTLDPFVISIVQQVVGSDNGGGFSVPTEGIRLFRLVRLFRLTRFLRKLPEILILIKGIKRTLVTVSYTIFLLAFVTYVFAIALRNTVPAGSEIETVYFPTTLETVHGLILHGAFVDNLTVFILALKKGSVACFVLSWLYICSAHLMIMNLLVGILCEIMAAVASNEKDAINASKISDKFFVMLSEYDHDEDGFVEWEEFAQLLETAACQEALNKFDVDVDTLVDMVEDQFFSSREIGDGNISIALTEVIELIVELRGSKAASVKDVMNVGKRLNARFRDLKENLQSDRGPTR